MQVLSQLLVNLGETYASRLAWLDRPGAVTPGGVLQEFWMSRHKFSHMTLPEDPVLERHGQIYTKE